MKRDWTTSSAIRFLKTHPPLSALLLSTVAEGLCITAIFLFPLNSVLGSFPRDFHAPAAFCATALFPDVAEGYSSKAADSALTAAIFVAGWLQWFALFFLGLHLYCKQENPQISPPTLP